MAMYISCRRRYACWRGSLKASGRRGSWGRRLRSGRDSRSRPAPVLSPPRANDLIGPRVGASNVLRLNPFRRKPCSGFFLPTSRPPCSVLPSPPSSGPSSLLAAHASLSPPCSSPKHGIMRPSMSLGRKPANAVSPRQFILSPPCVPRTHLRVFSGGNKATLITRLQQHDNNQTLSSEPVSVAPKVRRASTVVPAPPTEVPGVPASADPVPVHPKFDLSVQLPILSEPIPEAPTPIVRLANCANCARVYRAF